MNKTKFVRNELPDRSTLQSKCLVMQSKSNSSYNEPQGIFPEENKSLQNSIIEFFKKLAAKSLFESRLQKTAQLKSKEVEKKKAESLKISVFFGLFVWLFVGVLTKNILLSGGLSAFAVAVIFIILIWVPLAKKRAHARLVEAQLPLFLLHLASEIRLGKSMQVAILESGSKKDAVSIEFEKVSQDLAKGASFSDALQGINERLDSRIIRRAVSNISNIFTQGARDTSGLKKLAQEMLLIQRIEAKEFSGKMVVFALVFIAVSAIVPAMFQSFLLIGSYFMSIKFTALEAFLICVAFFPAIDAAVLFMIESKTPVFLRG